MQSTIDGLKESLDETETENAVLQEARRDLDEKKAALEVVSLTAHPREHRLIIIRK